jgi:hypothetical protein
MSKRIVLVDAFGYELFSGASVANESKDETVVEETRDAVIEDARQGGPLESGIFFRGVRGAPRLRKTG